MQKNKLIVTHTVVVGRDSFMLKVKTWKYTPRRKAVAGQCRRQKTEDAL